MEILFLHTSCLPCYIHISAQPMKIVINTQHGGCYLSKPAIELYCRYKKEADPASEIMESAAKKYFRVPDRADPTLVRVVEEMGSGASGSHSLLKVVEIPDGVKWTIEDYDGVEWVAEVHRTWD